MPVRNERAMRPPQGNPTPSGRPETNLADLRRRRKELEDKNRELAAAAARSGKTPTAAERAVMQANLAEIRSIKDTLYAFGALYSS